MAKVENLKGPIGWLTDPQNKWAINFNFKKGTNDENSADFTIDMWGVVPVSYTHLTLPTTPYV